VNVSRFIRVRFGPVTLPRLLRPGRWQELDKETMTALLDTVGLPPEEPREYKKHKPDASQPTPRSRVGVKKKVASRTRRAPVRRRDR